MQTAVSGATDRIQRRPIEQHGLSGTELRPLFRQPYRRRCPKTQCCTPTRQLRRRRPGTWRSGPDALPTQSTARHGPSWQHTAGARSAATGNKYTVHTDGAMEVGTGRQTLQGKNYAELTDTIISQPFITRKQHRVQHGLKQQKVSLRIGPKRVSMIVSPLAVRHECTYGQWHQAWT